MLQLLPPSRFICRRTKNTGTKADVERPKHPRQRSLELELTMDALRRSCAQPARAQTCAGRTAPPPPRAVPTTERRGRVEADLHRLLRASHQPPPPPCSCAGPAHAASSARASSIGSCSSSRPRLRRPQSMARKTRRSPPASICAVGPRASSMPELRSPRPACRGAAPSPACREASSRRPAVELTRAAARGQPSPDGPLTATAATLLCRTGARRVVCSRAIDWILQLLATSPAPASIHGEEDEEVAAGLDLRRRAPGVGEEGRGRRRWVQPPCRASPAELAGRRLRQRVVEEDEIGDCFFLLETCGCEASCYGR
ncbi:unnamed protein product [Urochloa humidicola]